MKFPCKKYFNPCFKHRRLVGTDRAKTEIESTNLIHFYQKISQKSTTGHRSRAFLNPLKGANKDNFDICRKHSGC
jgi:hypothetical protein